MTDRNPLEPVDPNDKAQAALWDAFVYARSSPELLLAFFRELPPDLFNRCVPYWISRVETRKETDDGSYGFTFWHAILPLLVERQP